jgi:hypothetical protein
VPAQPARAPKTDRFADEDDVDAPGVLFMDLEDLSDAVFRWEGSAFSNR